MRLYKLNNDALIKINEEAFGKERTLQNIVENNLNVLMGLQVVKSEFAVEDRRFDTLAYDPENESFVIIEYKRDRNSSVVDQGFTYLYLLLNHKADAVLAFNNHFKKNLTVNEIDWEQTKVIFVSTAFTDFQQGAIGKGLPIELWEIKRHGKDLYSVVPIKKTGNPVNISEVTDKKSAYSKLKELKSYTEEELLSKTSENVRELYAQYRDAILNLDSQLETKATKLYIAFKKDNTNICDIEFCKNKLMIFVNAIWGDLDDPKNLFQNMKGKGHHGNGDYKVDVSSTDDLEYILSVIKKLLK